MQELLLLSCFPLQFLPIFVFIDLILWLDAEDLYNFNYNVDYSHHTSGSVVVRSICRIQCKP